MSPGTVFHEGNNPHAAGIGALYPPPLKLWEDAWSAREADYAHELYRRVATEETGKELFPGAHARFWLGKAWGYIATHPAAWAALTLRKIWLEFSSFEIHDLAGLAQAAGHLEVLPFPPFGLFAGLALLGAISFRREIPKIIWAGSAWFALVPVLFYVSARQRMPLWLFLLFLSGLGMEAVFRKPWRLILLAVLAGLSFWIPVQARQYREMTARIRTADQWKNEVKKDLVSGARGKAAQDMSRCIGAAPWLELYHSAPFLPYPGGSPQAGALADSEAPRTPFERGVLCFSLGRDEEVAKLLEPGAGKPFYRHYYAVEPPAYYMSASLYRLGRTEEARSALARGLAAFPMNGPLLALKEAIEGTPFGAKGHDLLSRHHYLGRAFFHLKMYRLALPHFEALSVLAPELLYPHDYLGVCHGMMGRYVEMARELDLLERTRPASSLTPQWREVLARMEAEGREDPFLIRLREAMQKMFPQAISSP
jgi:tetratricopeptide (TPR) repeat protein